MIGNILKHFLYDVALNVFFNAINTNFINTDVNLIGKMIRLTNLESGNEYHIIVSAFDESEYALPNVRGLVKYVDNVDCEFDVGKILIFELDYFSMKVA